MKQNKFKILSGITNIMFCRIIFDFWNWYKNLKISCLLYDKNTHFKRVSNYHIRMYEHLT